MIIKEPPKRIRGEEYREYQRNWSRNRTKERRKTAVSTASFDDFDYKVVPNSWRSRVPEGARRERYSTPEAISPLVRDLLRGKTCYVDYTLPFGQAKNHPFRTLYSYFTTRGYRLRVHVVDIVEKEEFRKILMWAEPVKPQRYPKEESAA